MAKLLRGNVRGVHQDQATCAGFAPPNSPPVKIARKASTQASIWTIDPTLRQTRPMDVCR